VRVYSLTLLALSGACDMIPRLLSWLATLQPLALVVSPRLGLRQKEPKTNKRNPNVTKNKLRTPKGNPNEHKEQIKNTQGEPK